MLALKKSVCQFTSFMGGQIRLYNPQILADMVGSRIKDRAKNLQLAERKQKTFKPALDHFRLTRFGWEHRKAGAEGERRRSKSAKSYLLSRRIGYVNPRDYKTMRIYFPHVNVKLHNSPVDTNINIARVRQILPAHIG
jgi:hypothetical protein